MKSILLLSMSLALAVPVLAQDKPKAIDATDVDAIKAAVGKRVTITGTVASFTADDKTKNPALRFEGSKLEIYILKDKYWKAGGWGLDSFVGKTLFVNGVVVKRTSVEDIRKLELSSESHYHENLGALIAGLPKPKPPAKPKEEEPKTYEPVSPGAIFPVGPGVTVLDPKLDTASVNVILPSFGSGTPTMVVTEVTAEIQDAEEAGPMQATFELKPKLSIKPMAAAMTLLPKRHKAKGWPMHKNAHFIIDEIQADSAPPNLAGAVLIDAMLSGVEIPENVILFGGLSVDGKVGRGGDRERADISYVDAIQIAASATYPPKPEDEEEKKPKRGELPPKPEKTLYFITGNIPDATLDDLIIDEAWDALNSTIVLRCASFDDVMATIQEISEGGDIGKTISGLATAQESLRRRSIRMLSDKAVWASVVAAGKASKNNATAYAYARIRTRKVSESYSLDRCIANIHKPIERTRGGALDKFSERDLRKYMRDLAGQLRELQPKLHPDTEELMVAAGAYLKEIEDRNAALKKVKAKIKDAKERNQAKAPERVEASYQAAKKVYEAARAAAKKKLAG